MKKFLIAIILAATMMLFLSACVSSTGTYHDAEAQIWTGDISGMIIGDITMKAWNVENSVDNQKTVPWKLL